MNITKTGRLNLIRWSLKFVGTPSVRNLFHVINLAPNFEVVPTFFFNNLCITQTKITYTKV